MSFSSEWSQSHPYFTTSFFVVRSIMYWHILQKKLHSPSKTASFLAYLITWSMIRFDSPCKLINWSHHTWPTNKKERMDPNMYRCISEAFLIIISCPSGRSCFCMERYNCTKSLSVAYPIIGIEPVLFSTTLSTLLSHSRANVRSGIPYSQTAFACEVSPVWIFVMASSTSPEE